MHSAVFLSNQQFHAPGTTPKALFNKTVTRYTMSDHPGAVQFAIYSKAELRIVDGCFSCALTYNLLCVTTIDCFDSINRDDSISLCSHVVHD